MSDRTAVLLAWVIAGMTMLLLGTSVLFSFLGGAATSIAPFSTWQGRIVEALGGMIVPVVGGLIAARQPRNPYGWVWLVFGLSSSLLGFAVSYALYALFVAPGTLPFVRSVVLLAAVGWVMWAMMVPFTLLLFPTGQLPSRRWRGVAWAVVVAALAAVSMAPIVPGRSAFLPIDNPFGVEGILGVVAEVTTVLGVFVIFAAIWAGVVSLVVRFRRATGEERQQLKWFAYAAVIVGGHLIVQFFVEPPGVWDSVVETATNAVLPIAIGIAILRYRLYDIDVIINRTLVYGTLTVLLALVYIGSVVGLQRVFRIVTGETQSELVTVVSTLAIAALFQPLRRRIQTIIDRRFYRRKYERRRHWRPSTRGCEKKRNWTFCSTTCCRSCRRRCNRHTLTYG